jgi:hypothetical protein
MRRTLCVPCITRYHDFSAICGFIRRVGCVERNALLASPLEMQGRPEEILEVEAVLDDAATRLADVFSRSLPGVEHAECFEWCKAELSCSVEDLGGLMFGMFGAAA